jgi:hypothetical protein
LEKRKLNDDEMGIAPNALVKVTTMNHIVEVQFMEKVNSEAHIRKLNANEYVDLKTGEVKEFEKTENRSQGTNSLRKTFNRLRELINTNFEGASNELFVTLTYRGELQTNDTKTVYEDFKNFMKRLKYKYKNTTTIDYINVLEPHATGNFHMHVLMRFNDLENIYIPNAEFAEIWGNGFVQIQSLKNVDNIGAYVSAYLADIEVPEDKVKNLEGHPDLIEKEVNGKKKKFMKGARLVFYPTGVNIYRKSKGIRDAEIEKMSYKTAQKKLGAVTPNFKYGVELIDNENDFRNTLIKEQYNLKR